VAEKMTNGGKQVRRTEPKDTTHSTRDKRLGVGHPLSADPERLHDGESRETCA
jgi:hypothetical protein